MFWVRLRFCWLVIREYSKLTERSQEEFGEEKIIKYWICQNGWMILFVIEMITRHYLMDEGKVERVKA